MTHGVCLCRDGTVRAWVTGNPSQPIGVELPVAEGDRVYDLSMLSYDEAQTLIAAVHEGSPEERTSLLETFPVVEMAAIPPPAADHLVSLQPGYRRVVHRPTEAWMKREALSRVVANQRLQRGDRLSDVVKSFSHLASTDRSGRIGAALPSGSLGVAQFPAKPLVKVNATGARTFPWHTTVHSW